MGGTEGGVGVVRLASRLLDELLREVVHEPLREVDESRQRRHEHDAALGHQSEQLGRTMERQPVLDGIDALLDRDPSAAQTLGVGRDAIAHPVRLVDDGRDFVACHLGGLGVLADHRPGAGRHDLDEVRAVADLLADRLAHLPWAIRGAVHRPEDDGAG
jgi:hypothetical protein